MKHTKKNCSANNLFYSGNGLQCGNCLAVDWENPELYKKVPTIWEKIKAWFKSKGLKK